MSLRPLPSHPPPNINMSIGKWIECLSRANLVDFNIMFMYIAQYSSNLGFLNTLHKLTRVPIEIISSLDNEFKSRFWDNMDQCPIRSCKFSNEYNGVIDQHLKNTHNLGVYYCPICHYKTKIRYELRNHNYNLHKSWILKWNEIEIKYCF